MLFVLHDTWDFYLAVSSFVVGVLSFFVSLSLFFIYLDCPITVVHLIYSSILIGVLLFMP
ncbi:hypothetical protein [Candidatus Ichthyocystis sparus]|uniref:hypothetical protein n=1 Tax=Candidatus Ichthyocystis sparus TaxID=1561004 RepID=UPI000B859A40|nr:hypothetical protein [Candidatus Ichthyocystis sparus]